MGVLLLAAGGCGGVREKQAKPKRGLDSALRPIDVARGLPKLGRVHFRGVARFQAGPDGGQPDGVTTETDVWMDDLGNWRLVELNDKDGGREVVRHGRELAVALRYGKMIRRPAEDPEPRKFLEEALGAPWAAWDLLRDVATVDDFGNELLRGRPTQVYKITKAAKRAARAKADEADPRRRWRTTLVPDELSGTIHVDQATGVALAVQLRSRYRMERTNADGSRTALRGSVEVQTLVDEIGTSPVIVRPEAEDLALRQRTVPEQKALLGGLSSAPPPPPRAAPGGKP